jgi:hypothetical protein
MALQPLQQRLAVAQSFDEAEVVGDLADARIIGERRGGEFRSNREADARVHAAAQRGDGDTRALIAGCLQSGEGFAGEELRGTERTDRRAHIGDRTWGFDQPVEVGVAAQNLQRKAARCDSDVRVWKDCAQRGEQRRGVNGSAERKRILQQHEVAQAGERGLLVREGAFQRGERGDGSRFHHENRLEDIKNCDALPLHLVSAHFIIVQALQPAAQIFRRETAGSIGGAASVIEYFLRDEDRAVRAQRKRYGVGRARVERDDFPALVHPDGGVKGVLAQRADDDASNACVQSGDGGAQADRES